MVITVDNTINYCYHCAYMNLSKRQIELLAPAKTAEIGIAAINCGADAVYISCQKFGARENAGNSLSDIEKLISYAHKFYARVYIALNTILRDDELDEALTLINNIYSMGPDGLIIQDFGILELPLPPIPLIASTQMNNDSPEKILFLEKIGFKRAILPREMSLNEIKEIKKKTSIELECFIHGALCVSYSGQCYLSYAVGGRSANRGKCAQPCRQVYSLLDSRGKTLVKDRHLLSLKDLNRSDYLKELIDAGITSFKIEGRLKDLSYVTNIVSFYRKKLDILIDGKTTFEFTPDPYKTFNRGYTAYGIEGNNNNMASIYTPKSLGEKIGEVKTRGADYFTLSSKHDLKNGDGICWFDSGRILIGSVINKVSGDKIYPDKIRQLKGNTVIYRNYNKLFAATLERCPSKRKISISFILEETSKGFKLCACDEDGNNGHFSLPADKINAQKKALAESIIKNQLSKLNETIFICHKISLNMHDTYLIPLSILNQLRRGAIQALYGERERNRPRSSAHILINDIPYPLKTIDYLGNCLNKKAEAFYNRHGAKVIEPAAESGITMKNRLVMVSKYCIRKELDMCSKKPPPLYLIDTGKRKYLLKFNCRKCNMEVYL